VANSIDDAASAAHLRGELAPGAESRQRRVDAVPDSPSLFGGGGVQPLLERRAFLRPLLPFRGDRPGGVTRRLAPLLESLSSVGRGALVTRLASSHLASPCDPSQLARERSPGPSVRSSSPPRWPCR